MCIHIGKSRQEINMTQAPFRKKECHIPRLGTNPMVAENSWLETLMAHLSMPFFSDPRTEVLILKHSLLSKGNLFTFY